MHTTPEPAVLAHPEFSGFPKIARLSRNCIISEKIDGTNAQIVIDELGNFYTGSRTRWIKPGDDNFGFAKWAHEHRDELVEGLGVGQHFGEWWGSGIQRGYGLPKGEKRFSLFNAIRWAEHGRPLLPISTGDPRVVKTQQWAPACCQVVPVFYRGPFSTRTVEMALDQLQLSGSFAAPGFMKPEGVVCFHIAAGIGFKKTIEGDEMPKSVS